MSINVRFGRRGFYHPAFGRLGIGDDAGKVYTLPDTFDEDGLLPRDTEYLDTEDEVDDALVEAQQEKPEKPKQASDAAQTMPGPGQGRKKKPTAGPEKTTGSVASKPKAKRGVRKKAT